MFFWRLISLVCLIIALFLFIQSLLLQDIRFFYGAIAFYSVASLVWLTIKNLYVDFCMPKNPKNNTDGLNSGLLFGFEIIDFFDIILSLPKIIFLFFIRAIYN